MVYKSNQVNKQISSPDILRYDKQAKELNIYDVLWMILYSPLFETSHWYIQLKIKVYLNRKPCSSRSAIKSCYWKNRRQIRSKMQMRNQKSTQQSTYLWRTMQPQANTAARQKEPDLCDDTCLSHHLRRIWLTAKQSLWRHQYWLHIFHLSLNNIGHNHSKWCKFLKNKL